MNQQRLKSIIQCASDKCVQAGTKLTQKRAAILRILVKEEQPLSAYDLLDRYNTEAEQKMAPMSVYRILEFLQSVKLVHKISNENKFLACTHIMCDHEHHSTQFLICRECRRVKEVMINQQALDQLSSDIEKAGFQLINTQIELDCLCNQCLEASTSTESALC